MILEKVKILNESMVQLKEALKGIEKKSLGKAPPGARVLHSF